MFTYHIDINDYLMLSFGTIQIVMIPNDYLPVWEKWQKYLPKKSHRGYIKTSIFGLPLSSMSMATYTIRNFFICNKILLFNNYHNDNCKKAENKFFNNPIGAIDMLDILTF
jgi:hypothetical protein